MSFKCLYCKPLLLSIFLVVTAQRNFAQGHYGEQEFKYESFNVVSREAPFLKPDQVTGSATGIMKKDEPLMIMAKSMVIKRTTGLRICITTDKIDLSKSNWMEVHPNEFKMCPKVLDIDLSQNLLSTLPSNVFESNHILHFLNLSYNSFTELNPLWFATFSD